SDAADLRATDISQTLQGLRFRVNDRFDYHLPVLGPHNAINALAAIAVGRRFGMEHDQIAAALTAFQPPPMRMQLQQLESITLINDAYNANPTGLRAAIATLDALETPHRKVVIVG